MAKSTKKRNALGRGLNALLDDSNSVDTSSDRSAPKVNSNFTEVNLENIETNPYQPRIDFDQQALAELAESIKIQGIIQPITVRKLTPTKYQLISGERRFQASKLAGLKKVPAYIRTANDQEMLEMALIENIQRENLNAIEVALSYQRLMTECDLKQEELGDRVGKSRSTVTNFLRLLKLPPDIQKGVREAHISMGHAKALAAIENIDIQLEVFKRIISEGLSVRKAEEMAKLLNANTARPSSKEKPESKANIKSPELQKLQDRLSSHFGTRIGIQNDNKKNKGEIRIPYVSIEDLNRILEILDL